MIRTAVVAVISCTFLGLIAEPAFAWKQFQDQWWEIYTEDAGPDFQKLVKKEAKCLVCHQGKRRQNHNDYGIHLVKLLTKADRRDEQKIVEAIKTVGKMHSDQKDEESPTYDEIIASGKLPGGDLEELKKEPKKAGAS